MIKQGHIVFVPFPFSNLLGTKRRPVLVISNEKIHQTQDFIGVAISTTTESPLNGIPLTNQYLQEGSLDCDSIIYPHKIGYLEKRLILKTIAKIDPSILSKVLKTLHEYVNQE